MSNQLFITVRYGENKEEIFNPHCKGLLLLKCIREKCQCSDELTVDLVDENGSISNLSDISNQTEYANHFLEGRRKYVLVKITKTNNPEVEPNKYESLLNNIEKLFPDLAERLERLSKPTPLSPKGKSWNQAKKRMTGLVATKTKSAKRNSVIKI